MKNRRQLIIGMGAALTATLVPSSGRSTQTRETKTNDIASEVDDDQAYAKSGKNNDITSLNALTNGSLFGRKIPNLETEFVFYSKDPIGISLATMNDNGGSSVLHNYHAGKNRTPTQNNTLVGGYGCRTWNGSSYSKHATSAIHFVTSTASSHVSTSDEGAYMRVLATPKGHTDHRVQCAAFNGYGDIISAPDGTSEFTNKKSVGTGIQIIRYGINAEYNALTNTDKASFIGTLVGTSTQATPPRCNTIFGIKGHDGTDFTDTMSGMRVSSTSEWNKKSQKAEISFFTCSSSTPKDRWKIWDNGTFLPAEDKTYSIGHPAYRVDDIFLANSAISTSDSRQKTEVRSMTDREIDAAKKLSKEIGFYQWISSIEKKGNNARIHCGLTVQKAMKIMKEFGLDPMRYGFICYDEFIENGKSDGRYSFRFDQLNLFIAKGLEERLSVLEQKL